MNNYYILELNNLKENIDIETAYLNYEDTFSVIRDFFKKVILSPSNLKDLGISTTAAEKSIFFIGKSYDYENGKISENELTSLQTEAWGDFKSFINSDKNLVRLVLCCLTGKKKYLTSVDNDMQDNYIGLILVLAYELHSKFGKEYREFIESHPAMQKYKI
jgi:hypothetical protein